MTTFQIGEGDDLGLLHSLPKGEVNTTNAQLTNLLATFRKDRKPIPVNFRELVNWIKYGERATHLMHPYPAKLLPHIPYFFLQNSKLSKPLDLVMDPFCGSGTVLLESLLAGRNAIGFDCNPFSAFLARTKNTRVDATKLKRALGSLVRRAETATANIPQIVNCAHWYSRRHLNDIGRLRAAILSIGDADIRNFMLMCLSATARKVSNADPRVSVPVRLRIKGGDVNRHHDEIVKRNLAWVKNAKSYSVFEDVAVNNISRMESFLDLAGDHVSAIVHQLDARRCVTDGFSQSPADLRQQVQLIITSPPYAGAQKYVRATSLSLGWLDMATPDQLRPLERATIGREHFAKSEFSVLRETGIKDADKLLKKIYREYPLRAHIASTYLLEMRAACIQMTDALRAGGFLVIVMGNNQVCGRPFMTKEYVKEMLTDCRLSLELEMVDHIHSRGLMTKRNKTAGMISSEWVMLFKKS